MIPIHDEHGFLVAYAGRSIDGTEPKYRFPARFRKSIVLFNLHRAVGCGDSVIVVEGFFDAVNVHQAGLPCVVALMGCSLSRRQEELLQQHFREVVLLLDGDNAGRRAGAGIAQRLVSKVSTRLVELPGGTQPDMLRPTRFDVSVFRAISERWQPGRTIMEGSTPTMEPLTHDTYAQFLADLKSRIQAAQLRASITVNREVVLLYWRSAVTSLIGSKRKAGELKSSIAWQRT